MLKRVIIIDSGSTEFLPVRRWKRSIFETSNRRWWLRAATRPRSSGADGYHQGLAGHRVVAVRASFQETTRVLTDDDFSFRPTSRVALGLDAASVSTRVVS